MNDLPGPGTPPLQPRRVLVVACGAIAHELVALRRMNGWDHMHIQCLPAELHNRPDHIPAAVLARLDALAGDFDSAFVAYADCGTGGALDRALAPRGIERLPGAHCYEFFAGSAVFAGHAEAEPGTFYLTDFLARHFQRLVIRGLGLDRHPELMPMYFGHYRRVLYLAQRDDAALTDRAQQAATALGLAFERCYTGLAPLAQALVRFDAGHAPAAERVG